MSGLSCTQCHDQRQGQHLDGTVIPPTHLSGMRGQVRESPAVRP